MKQLLLAIFLAFTLVPAHALEILEYKEKLVAADEASESVYVIHFFAEWCTVCLAQKKILRELQSNKEFDKVKIYLSDFDFERKVKIKHNVERQSTLIIFRGQQEIARSLAVTDKAKLEEFLKKAL